MKHSQTSIIRRMTTAFRKIRTAATVALLLFTAGGAAADTLKIPAPQNGLEHIPLSSLDISKSTYGWGTPKANLSVNGNPIKINGNVYASGVGTHGPSLIVIKINGSTTDFYATLGIDDEINSTQHGEFDYLVYKKSEDGDTTVVASGTISCKPGGTRSVDIHADVNGWKYLFLQTTNGKDGEGNWNDHVDWANAYLVFQEQNSTKPVIVSEEELSSKLACATTVFSQPGVRFMHKVRASSNEATVSVSGLPEGLFWNAERKIVDGVVKQTGEYTYYATVTNGDETATEPIHLTVSDSLPLPVPYMGWMSWNAVQRDISEAIVKQVVELFKSKGLYEVGWNNIMLDDLWHADSRASDGTPRPNATRFPNGIKAVSDYVHQNGMHFGLYTDAANKTCAGAFGSFGYEDIDAKTYAEWNIDLVKNDYCNAPSDVETCKNRYKTQADAYKAAGYGTRLFVCEWGVREPWKWGAEVGGVCWRISQDVRDCWTGSGTGEGVVQSIRDMKNLSAYQGVNRFNDADMLCTGLHGTGKSSNDLCGSGPGMTQDEYRTQFALWCMWSSPLNLTFDPRTNTLTEDDYKILKNTEMIALNQDLMGQQADLVSERGNLVIFAKDCENGDVAVSVTNMDNNNELTATIDLSVIGGLCADSTYTCRDVQNQTDMPDVKGSFTTRVRSHATNVFRLSKKGDITAVSSAAAHHTSDISIKAKKGNVTVSSANSGNQPKRIVIRDLCGRVVSALTTSDASATIALPAGVYMVSVVSDAKATSAKVKV